MTANNFELKAGQWAVHLSQGKPRDFGRISVPNFAGIGASIVITPLGESYWAHENIWVCSSEEEVRELLRLGIVVVNRSALLQIHE